MGDFKCNTLSDISVMMTWIDREQYYLETDYQRESDVWPLQKRQLLIDSLLNRFDIPKFYLHEYEKPEIHNNKIYKYAIIDGKQRLNSIWQFMNNEWPLSDDIEYIADKKINLRNLLYKDLLLKFPAIHALFTGRSLTFIAVRTTELDLIEDMFSRLNEAVPLNAAEKRNAFGGPIPLVMRKIVKTKFFTERLAVPKTRYKHHDLACKYLYLIKQKGPSETKKVHLDVFVKNFKSGDQKLANELELKLKEILEKMCNVFGKKDPLLKSVGMVVIYFLLFLKVYFKEINIQINRKDLLDFDKMRQENRNNAEKNIAEANFELLEFDRLAQNPNDMSAIKFKLETLVKYILPSPAGRTRIG